MEIGEEGAGGGGNRDETSIDMYYVNSTICIYDHLDAGDYVKHFYSFLKMKTI
jgi:hypothetical protein